MTPDEIRNECDDIAVRWSRSSFDAREDILDRLESFSADLKHRGAQWSLRREIQVLHSRLTLSLRRGQK